MMRAKGLSSDDIFSVGAANILEGQKEKNKNTLNLWFTLIAPSNDLQTSTFAWVGIGCELAIDIL